MNGKPPSTPSSTGGDDRPDPSTAEGRRQIVALQALTYAIAPLTQAVVENVKAYQLERRQDKDRSGAKEAARAVVAADEPADTPEPAGDAKKLPRLPDRGPQTVLGHLIRGLLGKDRVDKVRDRFRRLAAGGGKAYRRARRAIRRAYKKGGVRGVLKLAGRNAAAGAARGLGNVFGLLAAGALKLLAPFTSLSMILGNNMSGMQTFSKAMQVAAGVMAPIFLPALVLAAASMIAVSDVLWSQLLPAFQQWFQLFATLGIPVMTAHLQGVMAVTEAMVTLANKMIEFANKIGDVLGIKEKIQPVGMPQGGQPQGLVVPPLNQEQQNHRRWELEREREENLKDLLPPPLGRGLDPAGQPARSEQRRRVREEAWAKQDRERAEADMSPEGRFRLAMVDVLKSLRMSVGPAASLGDVANPQRSAQMALLNYDPLDARNERRFLQIVGLLEQVILGQRPAPGNPFNNKP